MSLCSLCGGNEDAPIHHDARQSLHHAYTARVDLNRPEPPPIKNDRRATWDLVAADMAARELEPELKVAILRDMEERDRIGAAKYGVRLQSHNGRDHLADAYQEALDLAVYLRNEMEQRGVTLKTWDTGDDFEVRSSYESTLGEITRIRRVIMKRKPPMASFSEIGRSPEFQALMTESIRSRLMEGIPTVRSVDPSQARPRALDVMIGQLDRVLSEFLIMAGGELDEADRQTIKHHADDLIGVGKAAYKRLGLDGEW